MRIVGKGSDYYDSALGHGFDPNLCYVRKPVTTEDAYDHPLYHRLMTKKSKERDMIYNTNKVRYENFPSTSRRIELKRAGNYREIAVTPGLIGFCGKVYPFFCVSTEKKSPVSYNDKMERTFHYDSDSLFARCKELGFDIQEKGRQARNAYWYHSAKLTRRSVDEFLEIIEDVDELFHEIGNPTFAMYCFENDRHLYTILENPFLKEFQFYKKFDAYTTFQELSMYIGGVLGAAHPPMLEISDKDMAIKKGFGHKYAFRKEPEDMK